MCPVGAACIGHMKSTCCLTTIYIFACLGMKCLLLGCAGGLHSLHQTLAARAAGVRDEGVLSGGVAVVGSSYMMMRRGTFSHVFRIVQDIAIMARRRVAAVHALLRVACCRLRRPCCTASFAEGACCAQAQRQPEHSAGEAEPLRSC